MPLSEEERAHFATEHFANYQEYNKTVTNMVRNVWVGRASPLACQR